MVGVDVLSNRASPAASAVAGGLVVLPVGGPSISARSAAAGAPIPALGFHFYQACYRNPPAFACAVPATFNVTNAVAIQWFP